MLGKRDVVSHLFFSVMKRATQTFSDRLLVNLLETSVLRQRCLKILGKIVRTKQLPTGEETANQKSQLKRCLTTMDLTSLGVGSCVGTGMYLVAGMVARKVAGPAVVISFIIAATASIFSDLLVDRFTVRGTLQNKDTYFDASERKMEDSCIKDDKFKFSNFL
ncbi:putative cationic amino acid transporter [Nymphon striatum]|nr:putative cationic amino acid transporter [Nymphon striatum]